MKENESENNLLQRELDEFTALLKRMKQSSDELSKTNHKFTHVFELSPEGILKLSETTQPIMEGHHRLTLEKLKVDIMDLVRRMSQIAERRIKLLGCAADSNTRFAPIELTDYLVGFKLNNTRYNIIFSEIY